jgi:hypothetical protein
MTSFLPGIVITSGGTTLTTNRSFAELLAAFSAAVVANDGAGLAALFTADGIYADEFFGAHQGRTAIAAMLQRFHDTGRDYRWTSSIPSATARPVMPGSASASPRAFPNARAGP